MSLIRIYDIGIAHCGSVDTACEIVKEVEKQDKNAFVKFQYFDPKTLFLDRQKQEGMAKYALTIKQLEDVLRYCKSVSMRAGVTIFEERHFKPIIRELNSYLKFYKVASPDFMNIDLIYEYLKEYGDKPLFISTGSSDPYSIPKIVTEIAKFKKYELNRVTRKDVYLMHCVSLYPATNMHMARFETIRHMCLRHGLFLGHSDHAPGTGLAVEAIAMGAMAIEKHVTLGDDPDTNVAIHVDDITSFKNLTEAEYEQLPVNTKVSHNNIDEGASIRVLVSTQPIKEGDKIKLDFNCDFKRAVNPYTSDAISIRHRRYIHDNKLVFATEDIPKDTVISNFIIEGLF